MADERKSNEAAQPGGEYLVDGVLVDANGKPIGKAAEAKSAADDGKNLTKADLTERITALGGEPKSGSNKAELEAQLKELESAKG